MKQKPSSPLTSFDDLFPEDASRPTERRDDWVWIYIPFLFGVLVLAAIGFLVARAGFGSISAWADASLILVILPLIILGLIPLVLFGAMIYGVVKLTAFLPGSFQSLRRIIGQTVGIAQQTGDIAVRPLVVTKSSWAALQAVFGWLVSIVQLFKGGTHE